MFKAATFLLASVLFLFLPVPTSASSFDPDRFGLTVLQNPVTASAATITLQGIREWGWPVGPSGHEAPIALGSWLASDYCIPGSFSIDVVLSLWESANPDRVSVTAGTISGTFGSDGFGMISGNINSAPIYAVSMAYPYTPNVPTGFVVLIDKPHAAVLAESLPIPEPGSLILLGSGLVGLLRRVRF